MLYTDPTTVPPVPVKCQLCHSKDLICISCCWSPRDTRYLRRGSEPRAQEGPDRATIPGHMMAQYLLALLGAQQPGGMRGPGGDPIAELLFGGLSAQEGGGRPG